MNSNITADQEAVSQSEVEGLVAQIGGSPSQQETAAAPGGKESSQPLVFKRLSSSSTTEIRKLKARHEEFIRSLTARFSSHLRLEIGLKMSSLESVPFKKFIDGLSNPTHLALLKVEPLNGTCFLDIPPRLALSIVDREFGGPGEYSQEERALTEIESRILSKLIDITFREWCRSWSDMLELRPVLKGHEENGAFVQEHDPDTMMLVLGVEMQMGDLTTQMHFGFPYPALEPLLKKLNVGAESEKKTVTKSPSTVPKWNPVLDDVKIKLSAELPGLKIATKELVKLKTGDVIPLELEVIQNLRLSLANKPKFAATLGQCGPRWAAKITKILGT